MEMSDGGSVDTNEAALRAFDAAAGTFGEPDKGTNTPGLGRHNHLRRVVAYSRQVGTAREARRIVCGRQHKAQSSDSDVEAAKQPVEAVWRLFLCRAGQDLFEL
jgi:hypothetical protein